jgi:LPS O-antigen subunit length determinant protein (WzzB/FepE family)
MKILKKNLISSALIAERRLVSFGMEKPSGVENTSKSPDSGKKFNLGKKLDDTIAKLTTVKNELNQKKDQLGKNTISDLDKKIAGDKKLQNVLGDKKLMKQINTVQTNPTQLDKDIQNNKALQDTLNNKDLMTYLNRIDTTPDTSKDNSNS